MIIHKPFSSYIDI